MEEFEHVKNIVALDQSILVISDLHFPYAHQDWYPFLLEIKQQFKPDLVANVGDTIDGHRWSFHDSDEGLPSASEELEMAIEEAQHLCKLFPKMFEAESNHSSLLYRRMKHHGIPIRSLKPMEQLLGTPHWQWAHEFVFETHNGFISMVHGKTGAYNKQALNNAMSSIQGHYHQKFEITWHRGTHSIFFNMLVGCLIDEKSLAFAYGKNISKKPILGVGWINELGEPALIRMQLDKHGRWNGKL